MLLPFLSLARCAAIINERQSLTPPAECDVIPTWEVTSFNWFNSSSNLDCVTQANARKFGNQRLAPSEEKKQKRGLTPTPTSPRGRLLQLNLHTRSPGTMRRQPRALRPVRHRRLLHRPPAAASRVRAPGHHLHRHQRPRLRVVLRVQPAEHPALRGRQRDTVLRRRRVPHQLRREQQQRRQHRPRRRQPAPVVELQQRQHHQGERECRLRDRLLSGFGEQRHLCDPRW